MRIFFSALVVTFVALLSVFWVLFANAFVQESYSLPVSWFSFEPNEKFKLEGSSGLVQESKQVKFYPNVPEFLRRLKISKNSLGVRFSWDRQGSHYVDVIPEQKRHLGNFVKKASLWIWGGGFKHELALIFARVRDGYTYAVPIGKLDFYGWKNRAVAIPSVVNYKKKSVSDTDRFYFDKFRIYSDPEERVDNIYVFFDNFEVQEEIELRRFDGSDLSDVVFEEIQGAGQKNKNQVDSKLDDRNRQDASNNNDFEGTNNN